MGLFGYVIDLVRYGTFDGLMTILMRLGLELEKGHEYFGGRLSVDTQYLPLIWSLRHDIDKV